MLPPSFELPAALLLVLGGALSCFAGYRLFKLTLAIYGLIFGALLASSAMASSNTAGMIVAAIAGGIGGALILIFAYFVGIALIGAGLGAVIAHVGWGAMRSGDPPPLLVIVLAIAGAIGAMLLQRYVIVVATAFAGAWTILVGGMAMAGRAATNTPRAASHLGDVWIAYPTAPAPGARWLPIAWIALGVLGTGVQLAVTGRKR